MTDSDLQTSIVSAWQMALPLTQDSALSIANEILSGYPKQKTAFGKWFDTHGSLIVERMNHA